MVDAAAAADASRRMDVGAGPAVGDLRIIRGPAAPTWPWSESSDPVERKRKEPRDRRGRPRRCRGRPGRRPRWPRSQRQLLRGWPGACASKRIGDLPPRAGELVPDGRAPNRSGGGFELGVDAGRGPGGIAAIRKQQRGSRRGRPRRGLGPEPAVHGRLVLGDVRRGWPGRPDRPGGPVLGGGADEMTSAAPRVGLVDGGWCPGGSAVVRTAHRERGRGRDDVRTGCRSARASRRVCGNGGVIAAEARAQSRTPSTATMPMIARPSTAASGHATSGQDDHQRELLSGASRRSGRMGPGGSVQAHATALIRVAVRWASAMSEESIGFTPARAAASRWSRSPTGRSRRGPGRPGLPRSCGTTGRCGTSSLSW